MRVLFVTRKYPPRVGGMENLSYHVTTGFSGPKTVIALRRSQLHLWWWLPYAIVRTALAGKSYDVLHLGDPVLAIVGWLPKRLFRRRIVVTLHGLDLTYANPVYQAYLRLFLRADRFVAISQATASLARQKGLDPVDVVPVGVEEQFIALVHDPAADPEIFGRRDGRIVMLTVARLVPRKGVAWFVENVLPKLRNVLYVVAGTGPDEKRILGVAEKNGTASQVWLLGQVPDERLKKLYASADIFVMPNIPVARDIEGFGIVAIEAAAAGLPVVASRVDGIIDAIQDGANGLLVEPQQPEKMIVALQSLTEDPSRRRSIGARAAEYTRLNFSWSAVVAQYVRSFQATQT